MMMAVDAARDPVFDLRLVTENDADWYGAVYQVPQNIELHGNPASGASAASAASVGVDIRNEGRIVWTRDGVHPFVLTYHWLNADGSALLDLPEGELPLPRDVPPGASIHIDAPVDVAALPGGTYRLEWDMVEQDVVQFYERGWPNAQTLVTVDQGGPSQAPAVLPRDDSVAPWVVPRVNLWQAAVQLIQRNPVLGVGTDNFRHLYGAELGLDSWDERVQANNLYLEILADTGFLGLIAFAWLVGPPLMRVVGVVRTSRNLNQAYYAIGVGLALLAFLVHGLFDTFLTFIPTAGLFAICLGFALAQKPHVSGR
ncbi:MAG: O-antigen ligase family protein [Chloroflexi bacterium]|nr:O-antigen ligase family protein [Chloroflexota bacterium]